MGWTFDTPLQLLLRRWCHLLAASPIASNETPLLVRVVSQFPIAAEADFDTFIAAHRTLLDERMTAVDARAAEGKLPDVTLTKGVLKISPIEKSTPPEAEALAARLYAMLPRIRITDLLAEVATWTLFPDCFTHLRTGETAADNHILMAGLLADGLNLGLTRMAEACSISSLGQLAWRIGALLSASAERPGRGGRR